MEIVGKSTKLETVVCGRCGGTGHYSFNQINGTVCFGCHGVGRVYTKRGAAAFRFLTGLRSVPVETLKVGDLMQDFVGLGSGKAFFRVTRIKVMPAKEAGYPNSNAVAVKLDLHNEKAGDSGLTTFAGTMVRKGFTGPEKDAQMKLACAYQDTLTKMGKPMKSANSVKE